LSAGYVVAEGQIRGVRSEIEDHPMQILIRCSRPQALASKIFQQDHVVEATGADSWSRRRMPISSI
jgi:ABC-2 type transport system ATP-binding protein